MVGLIQCLRHREAIKDSLCVEEYVLLLLRKKFSGFWQEMKIRSETNHINNKSRIPDKRILLLLLIEICFGI